jgi:prevent-host-death family protein
MTAKRLAGHEFSRNIGAAIDEARRNPDGVVVTSHGRPQVAIVSHVEYARLQEDARHLGVLRDAERAREKALGEGTGQ